MGRAAPLLVAACWLLLPGFAEACSTCMDPRESNRTLLWVTIFLSLLPLGLIGGVAGFVWWRARNVANVPIPAPALLPPDAR